MRQQIQSWLVPIDPADAAPGAVTLYGVSRFSELAELASPVPRFSVRLA
jgi:hypothetical protein